MNPLTVAYPIPLSMEFSRQEYWNGLPFSPLVDLPTQGLNPHLLQSVQFSSVFQSCLTFCDPMDCSTPGLPVHHQPLEFTQTHVHWVGDTIQSSHPLSAPSPPVFNLSKNEGLFKWVSSSHQVAKVLKLQLQYQSFQWIFRTDFLKDWLVWSPCCPRNSQEFSPTPQFKHSAFFMVQLPYLCLTTEKTIALTIRAFVSKVMSLLLICCLGWL